MATQELVYDTQGKDNEVAVKQAVDRLAEIERELDESNARALLKEADLIKNYLRMHISPKVPEAAHVQLDGYYGHVEFGPVPQQRVVTRKQVLKRLLGIKLFDQLATFSMKSLEEHLPNKLLDSVVEKKPGTRNIKRAWFEDQVKH